MATDVTGDLMTEAPEGPLASCDSAFSCLVRLRGRSEVGAVQSPNVVNGETLSISRLIEVAGDLGLKAEYVQLDWQRLHALGFSHSLLLLFKDTNVVLLTGEGRDGASEVAVWDPRDPYGETVFVPREDFERASTGHALIVATPPPTGASTSPSSDFCWFTSAGLELLGKTSARGKDPTELASKQLTPDPTKGAQSSPATSRGRTARREFPRLARFSLAAAGILVAAGSSTFLLGGSLTDPVANAIAFAKEVWAVAPDSGPSTDGHVESVPRTGSAPIPAAAPVAPVGARAIAAPPVLPAAPRVEGAAPSVEGTTRHRARPVTSFTGPHVDASQAAPTVDWDSLPATKPGRAAPLSISAGRPEAATPSATPAAELKPATPSATPAAELKPATPSATPESGLAAAAAANTETADPLRPPSSSLLSAEEMATLLARGDALLSAGDVTAARLFYERAADAGGGVGAIRLGETFDPAFLNRVRLRGARGDVNAASYWYHRARDLGIADADVLLKPLGTK